MPQAAQAIEETTPLGRIERRANLPPEGIETRRLASAACEDSVLVLETSEETIYATLLCDRFWDPESRKTFVGEEVAIVLEVTQARFRVRIETVAGAQAEFTVLGIWVE